MRTPDKDWRLALCVGSGVGIAVLVVPRLLGFAELGTLATVLLAACGFLMGLVAYSLFFCRPAPW